MITDNDNTAQGRTSIQARFVKEVEKELTPLVSVVGNEIKAAGMTLYRVITLVYYDYRPQFVDINFDRDWSYDVSLTEKENVDNVILVILNKITKRGIASSWDKLSVYYNDSYLSKYYKS